MSAPDKAPALPLWSLALVGALYVLLVLLIRAHAGGSIESMWSRFDESMAHLPEIRRILDGGSIAANDSEVAMVPGLHAFYAGLIRLFDAPAPTATALPTLLIVFNALFGVAVAWAGAGVLRAARPEAPAWQVRLLFGLLLLSPYTVSSALYLTTDNAGMALFFATCAAVLLGSGRSQQLRAAGLSALTVLVRHLYMPTLAGFAALSVVLRGRRGAAIAAAAAAVCAFLPFGWVWHGLVPHNFAGVHQSHLYLANPLAICVFVTCIGLLLAPLVDWRKLDRSRLNLALAVGAAIGVALCVAAPATLFHQDRDVFQDGALLYVLDARLSRLGLLWLVAEKALVIAGAMVLAALAVEARRQPAVLAAMLMLGLHLLALCFQERPYQRYFEGPGLVLLCTTASPLLRDAPLRATPLAVVWLIQIVAYTMRLL